MTTFDKLCRICSSPGEYEFFDIIPAYLHGNHNDFLSWQKPVNEMMEETTGLKTSATDGLPSRVCALCISYLKHAVTFRQQAVKNTLSLKAIAVLLKENGDTAKSSSDKNSLLITEQDLDVSVDRQIDTNLLANQEQKPMAKQMLNNKLAVSLPSADELEQQMRYLNILFDRAPSKRPQHDNNFYGRQAGGSNVDTPGLADIFEDVAEESSPTTDEEQPTDSDKSAKHNIFSYTEKPFQEDDIMESEYLRGIVTEPKETFKERKCRACSKRFMFEYTFQQHMNVCIEYKFLSFVEEVNRLLFIRQRKAISPHEFIRRMIFCLRKTCEWLKESNCGEIGLPNLNEVGEKRPDTVQRTAGPPGDPQKLEAAKKILSRKIVEVFLQAQTKEHVDHLAKQAVETSRLTKFLKTSRSLLDESERRDCEPNPSEAPPAFLTPRGTNPQLTLPQTPINRSNNILYEIERSQSRSSYSTDTRSVDEFCAAPVMPSASISNEHLRKPIAIMARNPNQAAGSFSVTGKMLECRRLEGGESPAKPPPQILSHLEMERELLSKQNRKNAKQTPLEVQHGMVSHQLEQLQGKREGETSLEKREPQAIAPKEQQQTQIEAIAKVSARLKLHYENMLQSSQGESQRPTASREQLEAVAQLTEQFRRRYEKMLEPSQEEIQRQQLSQQQREAMAKLTENLKKRYENPPEPSLKTSQLAPEHVEPESQRRLPEMYPPNEEVMKQAKVKAVLSSGEVPGNALKHSLIEQEILAQSQRNITAGEQRDEQIFEIPILQRQLSHKELQREILRQNQLQIQAQQRNKQLEDQRREQEELRRAQRQAQPKVDNRSAQSAPELPKAFTAHCNPCGMHFESLTTLELHNAKYHNTMVRAAPAVVGQQQANLLPPQQQSQPMPQEEMSEYNRIIAMFDF